MKRQVVKALILGAGIGLTGCQGPSLGGLAFWKRNDSAVATTAPDVGSQKYSGLASQFGGGDPHRPMGAAKPGSTAIGQARPSESDGFLTTSWRKTSAAVGGASAAVTGALTAKPKVDYPTDDPLRLDNRPDKIGPEVYVSAARLLENQGKFLEAEEKYREALRAAPADLSSLVGMARLYDRQGQSQKAIDLYLKAAQAHPTEALIQNDLGLCYRRQRALDKSVVALQRAVQLQPDNAKYHNNLAAALVDAGRTDEALQALTVLNTPAVAHFNLAHMLDQKSQRNQAVQHLQRAVALDPGLTAASDLLSQWSGGPATSTAAARPESAYAVSTTAGTAVRSVASQPAAQPRPPASVSYTPPVTEPPSYHIGDDVTPAANVAQRPTWTVPSVEPNGLRPLPPIE